MIFGKKRKEKYSIPPKRTLNRAKKSRRRTGRAVPLYPESHRHAEDSGRRTTPRGAKFTGRPRGRRQRALPRRKRKKRGGRHRSQTARRRRAHRNANAQPTKGMATAPSSRGTAASTTAAGARRAPLSLYNRGKKGEGEELAGAVAISPVSGGRPSTAARRPGVRDSNAR